MGTAAAEIVRRIRRQPKIGRPGVLAADQRSPPGSTGQRALFRQVQEPFGTAIGDSAAVARGRPQQFVAPAADVDDQPAAAIAAPGVGTNAVAWRLGQLARFAAREFQK